MPLEYDHLHPVALDGSTVRENLWLASTRCNDFKGDRIEGLDSETGESVPRFNPRTQRWLDHFVWATTGVRILGLTATGRATVAVLRLNNAFIVVTRQFWAAAGWWPPADDVIRP